MRQWKQRSEKEKYEEVMLLPLKMELGTMSQGMQTAARSWKWQAHRLSP